MFRGNVVNALELLGLHLTPGPLLGGHPQGLADTDAGGDPVLQLFPVLGIFLLAA